MKVLLVTTAFPRSSSDSRQSLVLQTARALRGRGVQVQVVAMHEPGLSTRQVLDAIQVVRPRYLWPERLEVLQREGGGLPTIWRKSRTARLAFLPFAVAHTLAVMNYARNCDIVHGHWTLSGAAAWAGSWYHRTPYVVTVHGSDVYQAARYPLIDRLTRAALCHSRRVIAISRSLAQATARLGVPAHLIEVIPEGVDTDQFHLSPDRARHREVLYVGSLIERKGVRYLLQAFARAAEGLPAYRLVVVGEGPLQPELVEQAQSLGIADKVHFAGAQSQAEVAEWMQRARLLVLPSTEEGLGIVLLEALASGTPCIGTRVGGIPDIILPDIGVLVPPADPVSLNDALLEVLRDDAKWQHMHARAVDWVQTHGYTWDSVAAHLIEVYSHVVKAA